MATETQLWTWFLFSGVLRPQRAKTLLSEWESQGLTLQQTLNQLPMEAPALGLTRDETARVRAPSNLPDTAALRWNDSLYPQGLRDLPFKLRPALLFYAGEVGLLTRPIVYFAPGPLSEETKELLLETVGMFIGENLLLAAFENSPQATMILEELTASEGEVLLFARQGLDQGTLPEQEQALLNTGRLLRMTPLPPTTQANPAWNPVLEQVAIATATRCVFSSPQSLPETAPVTSSIFLATTTNTSQSNSIPVATNATEVLTWLLDIPLPAASTPTPVAPPTSNLDPSPSPEEMLRTLEKGGNVPEALRRKLFGGS